MNNSSRRKSMRERIAQGLREKLAFVELTRWIGVRIRSLHRWNAWCRAQVNTRAAPDYAEVAFAELVERTESRSCIVVQGVALVTALARPHDSQSMQ